jgi:hypothetical protein
MMVSDAQNVTNGTPSQRSAAIYQYNIYLQPMKNEGDLFKAMVTSKIRLSTLSLQLQSTSGIRLLVTLSTSVWANTVQAS